MQKIPEKPIRLKIVEDLIKTKLCSLSISKMYGVSPQAVRAIGTVTFGDLYFQREHMALALLFKSIKDSMSKEKSIRSAAIAGHFSVATYYKYYRF